MSLYSRQKDRECKPNLKDLAIISHGKPRWLQTNLGKNAATNNSMSEHFTKEITVKSRMSKISKDGFKKDILEWIWTYHGPLAYCIQTFKDLSLESCVIYSSFQKRLSATAWGLFMMPGCVDTEHAWRNRALNCYYKFLNWANFFFFFSLGKNIWVS